MSIKSSFFNCGSWNTNSGIVVKELAFRQSSSNCEELNILILFSIDRLLFVRYKDLRDGRFSKKSGNSDNFAPFMEILWIFFNSLKLWREIIFSQLEILKFFKFSKRFISVRSISETLEMIKDCSPLKKYLNREDFEILSMEYKFFCSFAFESKNTEASSSW
ncbi:hypothetical protein LEP1GSC151_2204 [Leptospira interrogans serovar Grippotyphosa str. LT2186]|uniref:Uncharacterized protein n=1 Tax=Leptospira interrogans serovar Grippotyphosa str. LT2186 TaxID=1001599 RepID=M3I0D8_LEPIR|nr:hypothetical protein LEP1GSC151_2204 [Leptospira interrogans serovar Grippotyphosa str. LT2186]